jgi:hypothetical protein
LGDFFSIYYFGVYSGISHEEIIPKAMLKKPTKPTKILQYRLETQNRMLDLPTSLLG